MNYLELLRLAGPETALVITTLIVLGADLLAMRELELRFRLVIGGMISCVGCLVAIGLMVALPQHGNFMEGMLIVDPLTILVKVSLMALTICTILLTIESSFTEHVGEYFALILLAALGMMFLSSTEDILMIFVSLELTSLSLYILTAFNKRNVKAAEAALKYFLFGGASAAFTLFGLSLIYGLSGETNLRLIASGLSSVKIDPLLVVAMVMVVIGFGFKVAAVPFHLWAPDAYEGAPIPSAAFIASGSKVASFFVLTKVMILGFKGVEGSGGWQAYAPGWVPLIAILATSSVVLGNLAAIAQKSVRRLLAYSAIAHAGYVLVGMLSHGGQSFASIVYYVVTYGLTTVGAFGVVSIVESLSGGDKMSDFAGLSRRAPVVSFCMLVFLLSLAGIPPLAGFFGKFYLFSAALNGGSTGLGLVWLVVVAVAFSAVSLYYYLQVLKQIYVVTPVGNNDAGRAPIFSQVVLGLMALGVVVLGCAPNLLVGKLSDAVKSLVG